MLTKYIGEIVEIVYMDRSNQLTQRRIEIKHIRKGLVYADCMRTGSPRTFREDQILAWQPAKSKLKPTIQPVQPLHPRLTGYTSSISIVNTSLSRPSSKKATTSSASPLTRRSTIRKTITTTHATHIQPLRHDHPISNSPVVSSNASTSVS